MELVAIRSLQDIGCSEPEVKALAKTFTVPSLDPNTGEAATRPGLPSDRFPSPYANEIAARAANNNALPPDLSLMTKARHDGPAYVYSLLTGYQNPPANLPEDKRPGTGLHYNRSEEHTSELQSLMRISYAVFCLKKKKARTNKVQ